MCEVTDLDISERYIGAKNGVVDLNTGKVLRPDEGRKHRVTRSLPDDFDPSATHDAAKALLSHPTMLTEQWGYFLHALGMAMHGQPWREKIGICLYDLNEGDTGKSAFTECLQLALGDYAGPVDAGVLRKDPKRSKNAHSTEKVALVGLRIGWVEESEEIVIDTPEWRNLIGNRTFTARELHQPMTTYVNTCMVILLGNGYRA